MAYLEIRNLDKFYGDVHAVRNLNLRIEKGEMFFLLGPSGSGKTTTLRAVAGLEHISSGSIELNGRSIVELEPGERDIGMVFQMFSLFPTLSPGENVGFPLRVLGLRRGEIKERVNRLVEYLGLDTLMHRSTSDLSDADKQRFSIARAIIRQPSLLLLDEPLTFLDAKLRMTLGAELRQLQREMGLTGLYVTHDQAEAMMMGDRIGVMNEGVLHQIGSPTEVYGYPATTFVARFVGSPTMNILPGRISRGGVLESPVLQEPVRLSNTGTFEGDVQFGVRPEGLLAGCSDGPICLTVDFVEWLGGVAYAYGSHDNRRIVAQLGADLYPRAGDELRATFTANEVHLFDPVDGRRFDVQATFREDVAST